MQATRQHGDPSLRYDAQFRLFKILDRSGSAASWTISHCPFCGEKLPEDLSDEWWSQAEKFGFVELASDKNLLPPEMLTDEWWRNQGIE
jgi:hypothetical protein